jgi:hypothetical protein
MRRWAPVTAILGALALGPAQDAEAQARPEPPHAGLFGSWTGGQFPAGDTTQAECFGAPVVIITRDVVLRATALDSAYRQRVIETVALQPNGVEFRFLPVAAAGARVPNDLGFGCPAGPNVLRVERRGPDEIVFPGCNEFPSPLKRCVAR